ncbi:hypothetical protein GCM10022268_22540 [Sphingomonas cynarae]|uniref:Uncharacterized protein n=1 Tax=Sphingomonas cynarae TaxID=930197 RepID=A0ABP7E7B7_9SPHN
MIATTAAIANALAVATVMPLRVRFRIDDLPSHCRKAPYPVLLRGLVPGDAAAINATLVPFASLGAI